MDSPETQDEEQTKQKTQHNMCWTPLYVNKTRVLLKTTGGNFRQNEHRSMWKL